MKTNKFIRSLHRYLSIFIAIQLLLWTVSGIYFAFNKIELIRGEQYRLPSNVEYRIFDRLGQQVIASNKDGNIVYRTYPDGNLLEKLSAEEAKLIASIKTSLEPVSASLLTESSPGSEYRGRLLPIYQITTSSKDDINIYLDPVSYTHLTLPTILLV